MLFYMHVVHVCIAVDIQSVILCTVVMCRACLSIQAIRKAPATAAIGFRQTANKFAIVVQLLLGQIPDRVTFRDPILRRPLAPYFKLTQGEI